MVQPSQTAFVFPGQGSQMVGMGYTLAETYPVARQTFEEADDILGYGISKLCFEGPEELLNDTSRTQPALFIAGVAALRALYEAGGDSVLPVLLAGHSLGELTAMTAAGALSFPDGLKLVQRRADVMKLSDQRNAGGGMAAVLGVDVATAESLCRMAAEATEGILVVANDNCPGQVVIAGNVEPLTKAIEMASAVGAKKAIRLNVSIAPHTPLMADAADEFNIALEATPIHEPLISIVSNTDAQVIRTAREFRQELARQLVAPVRWRESIETMRDHKISTYVEIGSKDVLTGLIKRIDRDSVRYVVDDPASLESYVGTLTSP